MTSPQKGKNFSSPTCHGLLTQELPLQAVIATPVARKPVGFCEPTTSTSPRPSSMSKSLLPHQQVSLPPSGSTSSKEMLLISTTSSCHSIMLSLMRREWVAWERRKSLLALQRLRNVSQSLQNGPQLGRGLRKQLVSLSPTAERNSQTMGTTLNLSLRPNSHHPIINSSFTMLPCAMKLQQDNTSSSLTLANSVACTQPSSFLTELKGTTGSQAVKNPLSLAREMGNPKCAISSMQGPAKSLMEAANTDTFVKNATNLAMERKIVRKRASEIYRLQLKYLRHNLWQEGLALSPTTGPLLSGRSELNPYHAPLFRSVSIQLPRKQLLTTLIYFR